MMNQLIVKARRTLRGKTLMTACAVVGAVALPQIVHVAGAALGVGNSLGTLLLPMHLFVFLAGLLGGPAVGLFTGFCAPAVSFLLSGMPVVTTLPLMTVELIGYGLFAGLLFRARIPVFFKLLIAQLGGRLLRFAVTLAATAGGLSTASPATVWTAVVTGLPGIVLQWIVVTLLVGRLGKEDGELH